MSKTSPVTRDQDVEIRGWVYNKRSSGKVRFILVRDGTGILQTTVFSADESHPLFAEFDELTQESSLIVRGRVREDKRAPGGYELTLQDIEIIQIAQDYPITPKEHTTPFLMEHRHLWLRSRKQHAVLQVRAEVVKAIRDFLRRPRLPPDGHAHPDARAPARGRRPSSRRSISTRRPT